MQTLTQIEFQAAFAHGAVQSVALEPVGSQFAVKFVTLTGEASLVQARGNQRRLFGTTDSALKLLHKLGVRRIILEGLEHWQPDQTSEHKRSRPDRAQALTHAAEYDRWVRAKVQASRNSTLPAIADDEWQSIRAEKISQQKAQQALQPR
jgi:hypothetical protein